MTCNASTKNTLLLLNVTRAVQEWYEDDTLARAICLKQLSPGRKQILTYPAYSSSYGVTHPYRPHLFLNYRVSDGLEDYYTTQSHSVDRAGTGYIGDYNGQLTVVRTDAYKAAATGPASVSYVYNSGYSSGQISAATPAAAGYSSMHLGKGWKLNYQQTITASDDYYQYLDADGTIHWFYQDSSNSSQYLDEDGLGLKLTKSGSDFTITDQKDNLMHFAGGYLDYIQDASGNRITIVLNSSHQVTSVTRTQSGGSAETIATFTYFSGYLSKITDAAGNATNYTYSNGLLTTVTFADGKTVSYTYNSAGKMLTAKDNESGYSMTYTYDGSGNVLTYTEKAGSTAGASVSITRYKGIVYYDYSGKDRTADTSDDLVTRILYDSYGRTITSSTSSYDNQLLYGAEAAQYQVNQGQSKKNNRLLTSQATGVMAMNYATYGTIEGLSSLGTPFAYSGHGSAALSSVARTGNKSISVTRTASTSSTLTMTANTIDKTGWYVMSAYIKGASGAQISSGGSIALSAGSSSAQKITWLNTEDWERIYVTCYVTANATLTTTFTFTGVTGTVYIDDIQIEKSLNGEQGGPSQVNLITNGRMDPDVGGWTFGNSTYTYFAIDDSGTFKYVAFFDATGAAQANILSPSTTIPLTISQTVPINLPGTQTFLLSGWAWGYSAGLDTNGASRKFSLEAVINYSNGTSETKTLDYSIGATETQYLVLPVVPNESLTVSTITIGVNYTGNINEADFTHFSLIREDAARFSYDDNGNLTQIKSPDAETQTFTYQGADLTSMVLGGYGTYTYNYDSAHRVTSATNDGLSMNVSYDSAGNTTGTTLTGGSLTVTTEASYQDKTLLSSVTDARGYTTNYTYGNNISKLTGQPTSVTTPNNATVTNTYQATNGRQTGKSISGTVSLGITYNTNGRVSALTRTSSSGVSSSQAYGFTYDAFGNMTGVTVGGNMFRSYTYGGNNGQLLAIDYPDGSGVYYMYDNLERISDLSYVPGHTLGVSYSYAGNGEISRKVDTLADREYNYRYDNKGRLLSGLEQDMQNTPQTVLAYQYQYDTSDRTTKFVYRNNPSWTSLDTAKREYSYTYNNTNGSLTSLSTPGGTFSYTYDTLKRVSKRTLSTSSGSQLLTRNFSFTANPNDSTKTTFLVSKVENKFGTGNGTDVGTYNYSYDNMGNVSAVTGADTASYSYDNQNQLTSEIRGGVTTNYSYDGAGNLRSRTKGSQTDTFTYGNSSFPDLLTAYNGMGITYDAAYRPIVWYNTTYFDWAYGTQLTRILDGNSDTVALYSYTTEGLRIQKVTDITTKYNWIGNQLISEYRSDGKTLEYYYDESGMPVAFSYKASASVSAQLYYYVTNLQGDILKIVDSSGNVQATYSYDAWGNLLSSSGILSDINPLRYRGYYFDEETGFYYLQSRYYDPQIGRFISPDVPSNIGVEGTVISFNIFIYCNNNPVWGFDPAGTVDWGGVVVGLGIIAATSVAVATLGIGTPLALVVVGAAISTGGTMMYAAATESAMVIDLSYTTPRRFHAGFKGGYSIVVDFSSRTAYGYSHGGGNYGFGGGLSYSTGIVFNYNNPEDYEEEFLDFSTGGAVGVDICLSPEKPLKKTTGAVSLTFSAPGSKGASGGVDYYGRAELLFRWRTVVKHSKYKPFKNIAFTR